MAAVDNESIDKGVSDAPMGHQVWLWYGLALLAIVLDQVTKWLATHFLRYAEPHPITSFFNLTLLHNKGAAFSFLSDAGGWQRWLFGLIAGGVSVGLVVWIARLPRRCRWEACALALVLGGALGNLIDRVLLGHVVDFIVVHYRDHYWPAFNIADSAITLGAAMLFIDMLRGSQKDSVVAVSATKAQDSGKS